MWKNYPRGRNIAVSNYGRGFPIKGRGGNAGKSIAPCTPHKGRNAGRRYICVDGKNTPVSRAVAETFIPNPYGKPYVCHRDGTPGNDRADNLYWGTPKENAEDTV